MEQLADSALGPDGGRHDPRCPGRRPRHSSASTAGHAWVTATSEPAAPTGSDATAQRPVARRGYRDRVSSTRTSFPPIESLAFLSDGEVTALITATGSVEWMCVPRMDGPSVFGAILDRGAGHSGSDRPVDRSSATARDICRTWRVPGPGDDLGHRHRHLGAHGRADGGRVRPPRPLPGAFDALCGWHRRGRRSALTRRQAGAPVGEGAVATASSACAPASRTRTSFPYGEADDRQRPDDGPRRIAATVGYWHAWLASGSIPDGPVSSAAGTLGADPQGSRLSADRCRHGRGNDVAARDTRGQPQLGLPLHLDPRRRVHHGRAPGPGLPRGGARVPGFHRRSPG